MTSYRKIFAKSALAAVISASLLTACSNSTETGADTSAGDTSKIKIATESSFKPFSYTDANGNLIGYEIDLIDALCAQMKADCDIISQDWDGLIPGLNAKKFDAAIAGMSITPERKEVVDFSDPYFHTGIILIGKKGDNITVDDLKAQPIAAQRATVAAQYLQDKHSEADIKLYDTQDNAYLDLTSGRVRAMMSDKIVGLDWLKTDAGKDYEVKGAEISSDEDAMGIAFRKGDPLISKFNKALAEIKANGTYDKITTSYFGADTKAAGATKDDIKDVVVIDDKSTESVIAEK